jgi:hypothetical protein
MLNLFISTKIVEKKGTGMPISFIFAKTQTL